MWNMIWPAVMIVAANTVYNIATKSTPENANPFISLVVTYLVSAAVCLILYFVLSKESEGLIAEFGKLNWTSPVLGLVIVGLEAGYIYLFRAGWSVNVASLVVNLCLAVILIFVGYFLYHESLTIKQVIGILLCCGGLFLINI